MDSFLDIGPSWQKQGDNICYGARDERPGRFTVKSDGFLVGLKLKHRSGYVTCAASNPWYQSRWGCGDVPVMTIITNDKRGRIFTDLTRAHYAVNGKTADYLVFTDTVNPIYVSPGMELLIWYSEDLDNATEPSNGGTHCVDVYAEVASPMQFRLKL